MNKQQWTWFSIRVFGLYLLVDAVRSLPNALSSLYRAATPSLLTSVKGQEALTRQVNDTIVMYMVSSFLQVIICAVVGVYLLRGGTFLFKLICPADEP